MKPHIIRLRIKVTDEDLAALAAYLKNKPASFKRRAPVRQMRDCLTSAIEGRLHRLHHETELLQDKPCPVCHQQAV